VRLERPRPRQITPGPAAARTLTALSAREAHRYTGLVAAVAGVVESELSDRVAAHRLSAYEVEPPALHFVPWRVERAAFGRGLAAMAAAHPCLVFTDVRDCYGAIRPEVVRDALADVGADPVACDGVRGFLRTLEERGVRGLPVGPAPSAVLANVVLAAADRTLDGWGVPYLRWVDDVVAGTPDRDTAERVIAGLGAALGRVGLALNDSKTRVVFDPSAEGLAVRASMGGRPPRVG
jgi:hypothetical protein